MRTNWRAALGLAIYLSGIVGLAYVQAQKANRVGPSGTFTCGAKSQKFRRIANGQAARASFTLKVSTSGGQVIIGFNTSTTTAITVTPWVTGNSSGTIILEPGDRLKDELPSTFTGSLSCASVDETTTTLTYLETWQ